jgi:parallel beta-helix repeat protein
MRVGRARVVALVAGGFLCLGAGAADAGSAPAIGCGSTLTRSTRLTADITGCPGTALVIGANGITVDLGGHTISGTNATGSEGIANDGHAGVRILGGRITDFRLNGVGMRTAPGSVVRGVTIRRIGAGGVEGEPVSAGIAIVDSPASRLIDNDVANDVDAYQSDGADVLRSGGSLIAGNRLSHNSWDGLVLIESSESRIVRNQFDANGNNGTEVNGASDAVSLTENSADDNAAFGIVLGSAHNGRVLGNSASRNDVGLFFFDLHDSLIAGNRATANRAGIELAGGQFGSDGNRLTGNSASRNDETGIAVEDGADGTVVSWNIANRNGGNGIDAVAGSIDGGGNRAHGNATPPQCINVRCGAFGDDG